MGDGLCLSACSSLGDLGGVVFTLLAVAWGAWQRYQRTRAVEDATRATAEKDAAVQTSVHALTLSMRPTLPVEVMGKPSLQTLEGMRPFPRSPPLPDTKPSADD